MKEHVLRIIAVFVLLFSLSPLITPAAPVEPGKPGDTLSPDKIDTAALAKIEPLVLKELVQKGMTTYIVYLRDKADLGLAQAQPDRLSQRRAVVASLQSTAQRSQASVLLYLAGQEKAGAVKKITSYWVFNGLAVTGDQNTLFTLATRSDVERIQANHVRRLTAAKNASSTIVGGGGVGEGVSAPDAVEWNVSKVRANEVWSALGITGQGVVVANMDTGVYLQHPALLRKYRGYNNGNIDNNYNWYDPTGTYPNAPDDGHGHGTHTMGTMVGSEANGSNQIGVAPGAQWVAIKVFDDDGNTTDAILHAGFQWAMAPTDLQGNNPDPAKAPDIVSNSWGDTNSSDQTFWNDILAWRAAGIMPVFAGGNNGPSSGSVDSPGSNPQSFAVGATNINDVVASFSGRGPSPWGEIKPEVVAPGVNVRSSVPPSVDPSLYQGGWNGTSMATPHGAGATALLWQARPDLTITATEFVLTSTALPLPNQASSPNNDYGWGRIDAFQAVSAVMNGGRFWGRVTDKVSGQPVAGAVITMMRENGDGASQTATDAQGYYTFTVGAGVYTVSVSNFWYIPQTVQHVTITAGYTTILDFALTLRPSGILRGQVSSGAMPITATIIISGVPMAPLMTDATGVYSVTLPGGTYDLRVRPPAGYRQAVATVPVNAGQETVRDFDLSAVPRILLVDADAWSGNSAISYYRNDLDTLLYSFDQWTVVSFTTGLPPTATLGLYDIVLWHQPSTSPGYIGAWPRLASYLDGGGRLFITGQDVGYWDSTTAGRAYYTGYLHARYIRDDSGLRSALGISGDIFAGISVTLNTADSAGNQTDPDLIGPLDAVATPVFSYTTGITTNGTAGLKIDGGSYQAIYLPFGLEGVGPRANRLQILSQALSWLGLPALSKAADRSEAMPGDVITFTLRLANPTRRPAADLRIDDPLPAGFTYIPDSATGGLVYNAMENRLHWQGDVAARTTLTFTFRALVANLPGRTLLTNTASLAEASGAALPSSSHILIAAPDLFPSRKSVTPELVASGQEITYTISLTNSGFSTSPVTVIDPLPAGTTYVAGSATAGAFYNAALNRIEWSGIVTATDLTGDEYTYTTSDDAGGPPFSWVDISGIGTRITLGDDETRGPFAIGFPFTFYDTTYTEFYVSSNGWLSFVPPAGSVYNNTCLPDPAAPSPIVAAWWDDLNPSTVQAPDGVYYLTSSDALILSFINVPRFSSGGPYTFQAILHQNGTITLQYLDMQGTRLNEATIGIQDATGTKGLNVTCNAEFVHNGLAVLVSPRVRVEPTNISFRVRVNDGLPFMSVITNTALASSMGVTYILTATGTANTVDLHTSIKSVDKTLASFGDSLTYTLRLSNTGTTTATAIVTDVLPVQLAYISGSASAGAFYDDATRSIRWVGPIGPSATTALSFSARILPGLEDDTVITNTAVVADPLGRISQLSATTLYRAADLSLSSKAVTPTTALVGQVVTYTILVVNGGGGPTNFTVTDTLPSSLTLLPDSMQAGHGTVTYDAQQHRLHWSGDLPGQHNTFLRFAAQVAQTGIITNTVHIQDSSGLVVERSAVVTVSGVDERPYRMLFPIIILEGE